MREHDLRHRLHRAPPAGEGRPTTGCRLRIGLPSVLVAAIVIVTGCSSIYYTDQNLNAVSVGDSKDRILRRFETTKKNRQELPGMQIRAARRTNAGKLLEVGEVLLITQTTTRTGTEKTVVPYWFLFEDGRLVQWGRPEDWRNSPARYEIHFNPSPAVPR